jgi:hypothetical protein
MYTWYMSRSFKTLAFSVALLWVVAPQAACFMPDAMTETEQQCCKEMANDCGGSGMSHECCRTVARPDVAMLAAANRALVQEFTLVERGGEIDIARLLNFSTIHFSSNQSPPVDTGPYSVILRI